MFLCRFSDIFFIIGIFLVVMEASKLEVQQACLKHNYRDMSAEELQKLLDDESVSKNQKKKIKKELDWMKTADKRSTHNGSRKKRSIILNWEKLIRREIRKKRKLEKRDQRRELMKRKAENPDTNADEDNENSQFKRKRLNKIKTTEKFDENIHVAIDCSFDDLMTNKDIRKLAGQISWCYKINRRCELPVQYHLYGMTTRLSGNLDPTFPNWDIHFDENLSDCTISKEKIVYLTAESDNILDELQTGVVYIIGGLVDHNHHKGYCHDLAVKNGYKTARLPLTENVDMKSRRVLTVNHVFELILARRELGDWKSSILKILPSKKIDGVKS